MADEYKGRTTRTTQFKVREVRRNEVVEDDPRAYVLEVIFGKTAHLHALSEADMSALRDVLNRALLGDDLPVER